MCMFKLDSRARHACSTASGAGRSARSRPRLLKNAKMRFSGKDSKDCMAKLRISLNSVIKCLFSGDDGPDSKKNFNVEGCVLRATFFIRAE